MIEKCISNSLSPWSSGKKSFYFGGMPDQVYGIKPVDIGPTERSEKFVDWIQGEYKLSFIFSHAIDQLVLNAHVKFERSKGDSNWCVCVHIRIWWFLSLTLIFSYSLTPCTVTYVTIILWLKNFSPTLNCVPLSCLSY